MRNESRFARRSQIFFLHTHTNLCARRLWKTDSHSLTRHPKRQLQNDRVRTLSENSSRCFRRGTSAASGECTMTSSPSPSSSDAICCEESDTEGPFNDRKPPWVPPLCQRGGHVCASPHGSFCSYTTRHTVDTISILRNEAAPCGFSDCTAGLAGLKEHNTHQACNEIRLLRRICQ